MRINHTFIAEQVGFNGEPPLPCSHWADQIDWRLADGVHRGAAL